jgi:hypothetical protein
LLPARGNPCPYRPPTWVSLFCRPGAGTKNVNASIKKMTA